MRGFFVFTSWLPNRLIWTFAAQTHSSQRVINCPNQAEKPDLHPLYIRDLPNNLHHYGALTCYHAP